MKESKEKRAQQIEAARTLYASGFKLTQIAEKLGIPDGTVRSWKNRGMLGEENATLKCNVAKNATKTLQRKRGGQPGNHNASGPPGNQHAVKYGFFSKMLPAETMDLINEIDQVSPIDLLWQNIKIQYAAILRAQKIMYVENKDDTTKELVMDGAEASTYQVQFAWDKQANFMAAQSRAMKTLESMISKYTELMDLDTATDIQKERLNLIKAQIAKLTGESEETEDISETEDMIYGYGEEDD